MKEKTLPELYEEMKNLFQIKHKSSPDRRITKIEKRIGEIKKQIKKIKENIYDSKANKNS